MEASISALSNYQISEFFSKNTPVTQQQCNQEAQRITGASASPSTVQGGTSYTAIAGTFVIQFRAAKCALDLELLGCVEKAYAGFVPQHLYVGQLGKLHVYQMDNIGGISMYLAREQLFRNHYHLLRRTLNDYAGFFASAWHNTPASTPSPNRMQLLDEYSSQLKELSQGLPVRFRQTLGHLAGSVEGLFAEDWPMVPNHTDLLENNIHVDPQSGKLMGICGWRDVEVSPFGISLGGLETMLGISKTTGWHYHTNHQVLRAEFWAAFNKATGGIDAERIEIARLVGIFLANGWKYDDDGNKVPAWEGTHDLAYLDAVVLGIQASTSKVLV